MHLCACMTVLCWGLNKCLTVEQHLLFATILWKIEHRKLPVHLLIYCQVVFRRHSGMADNFTGETVNRKDMGHPKHHQFFVLIDV